MLRLAANIRSDDGLKAEEALRELTCTPTGTSLGSRECTRRRGIIFQPGLPEGVLAWSFLAGGLEEERVAQRSPFSVLEVLP